MQEIFGTTDLSIIYKKGTSAESVALHDVNFKAYPEEFVVVYGPSGCGKSTLIYALTGIERNIDTGEVWVNGKNVASMKPQDLLVLHRFDVGMIFQSYNLISTLDVLQNVTLPLLAAGVPPRERKKKAQVLLERFRISHLVKRYPSQLSGGQQQRVAIARALITDPDIIVADEPTGNLDSESTEIVLNQLLELNVRDKKTILLVTHDPSFITYADRVLYMKDGQIVKIEEKKGSRILTSATDVTTAVKPATSLEFGSSPFDNEPSDELTFEQLSKVSCINDFAKAVAREPEPILERRLNHILIEVAVLKLAKRDALFVLQKPRPQGGMGYASEYAMDILTKMDGLFELRDWLTRQPASKRLSPLSRLYIERWLFGIRYGTLSTKQEEVFEGCLTRYLSQQIDGAEFSRLLSESIEHGGVGLVGVNTNKFVERLIPVMQLIPKQRTHG
ncbi:MAG: hypothetical protein A2845_04515 [Candidatus Lloydbacteria bacterium RIFCSPHIGHO2_01_FULL_49_22]|uniref:ABC transporter domain-containing protein n=1 Tax=Candidatus Lloydbacteria bacterium RIFCSPHIGHO2_01_FULL_49_22 TaxID=1798658 RepID=A0A1G2CW53_9BACT|nr:MAG: hypothetical protein A2845_04515 [Candidatus Lloydbacteria bacterium RIFCSPHIGHO2_01_FULL_49_22]OGZ10080.1 MAG: hypothetical protein A3C14_00550 [Candidatus Lloydbacteria bacterium RIFCSPHIGHO2_02_FULL_50_18]